MAGKLIPRWYLVLEADYAQCLDGLKFAFPNALKRLEASGEYKGLFGLYDAVKERPKIKEYLASERRQKYGDGIYRQYPELDEEAPAA